MAPMGTCSVARLLGGASRILAMHKADLAHSDALCSSDANAVLFKGVSSKAAFLKGVIPQDKLGHSWLTSRCWVLACRTPSSNRVLPQMRTTLPVWVTSKNLYEQSEPCVCSTTDDRLVMFTEAAALFLS
jgi:hypothetical protein